MFDKANVTMMVGHIDAACRFYTSLGFVEVDRDQDYFVELRMSGLSLVLHPRRGDEGPVGHGLLLGFPVADLDAVAAWLTSLGIAVERQENMTNRFAFFADPDGTRLYAFQPKAVPPSPPNR